jgi:hypothetical protein
MATITVTPGHTYGTTDTVTSTNLNDLGSPTAALTAGSILTADIADANVTTAKIADANVTTAKIADANVTTAKIADANVTFAKLADVIDDDTMATATNTTLATSESIKAYVDGTSAFTTVDGQSAGYQIFPSGLKMAWGNATTALGGTITFPSGVGFTVAPTVQISLNKGTTTGTYYGSQVGDVTTTNFVYKGSYGNLYGPRYLAIGI